MIVSRKLKETTKNWTIEMGTVIKIEASDIDGISMSCEGATPINTLGIRQIAEDLLTIAKELEEDPDFKNTVRF